MVWKVIVLARADVVCCRCRVAFSSHSLSRLRSSDFFHLPKNNHGSNTVLKNFWLVKHVWRAFSIQSLNFKQWQFNNISFLVVSTHTHTQSRAHVYKASKKTRENELLFLIWLKTAYLRMSCHNGECQLVCVWPIFFLYLFVLHAWNDDNSIRMASSNNNKSSLNRSKIFFVHKKEKDVR